MEINIYIYNLDNYKSLNPYCNERYSWRKKKKFCKMLSIFVLILIVMKDTHGEHLAATVIHCKVCLNPYCNERYSWRNLRELH